ncbi:hypothetical protein COLO4_05671 [Corchorus olitorius]|uniref:Uncharacterized protein n=1 Tax=Corchorus olitorius TaxID=93759 RepID=A0A1R3KQ88_9ROSI|nr:hypothetical protein COLO4_05671 [Corchorus olitorius]
MASQSKIGGVTNLIMPCRYKTSFGFRPQSNSSMMEHRNKRRPWRLAKKWVFLIQQASAFRVIQSRFPFLIPIGEYVNMYHQLRRKRQDGGCHLSNTELDDVINDTLKVKIILIKVTVKKAVGHLEPRRILVKVKSGGGCGLVVGGLE